MEAGENDFMGPDLAEQRRPASALRSSTRRKCFKEINFNEVVNSMMFFSGVGMRRTGDIEGVRQSSGNWQRGDNISWTKRLICEPLDKYSVNAIAERTYVYC